MNTEPAWRKLPPVSIIDVEIAIGRNHIQIHGLPPGKEFWRMEAFLASDLLHFKP